MVDCLGVPGADNDGRVRLVASLVRPRAVSASLLALLSMDIFGGNGNRGVSFFFRENLKKVVVVETV